MCVTGDIRRTAAGLATHLLQAQRSMLVQHILRFAFHILLPGLYALVGEADV